MRGKLIVELIESYVEDNKDHFKKITKQIIREEKKKGNNILAKKIEDAFKKNNTSKYSNSLNKANTFSSSKVNNSNINKSYMLPRDKDTKLDLYDVIESKISLNEVILPENQKKLILDIIKEFNFKEELIKNGLSPANKLLLYGPPGCGKTMTAKAVAHELGLPLIYVRLDSLISSYLGQTGNNLRKIFDSVKNERAVLFLDEFDSIAKKRDDNQELGELKRIVTTLLQNLDLLNNEIFLIAATNHEQLLDPAVWRRFNNVINLNYFDKNLREKFINRISEKYSIDRINSKKLSKLFENISPAQIEEIIKQTIKKCIINQNKNINFEEVIRSYSQYITNNSINKGDDINWKAIKHLHDKGLTFKTLESVTSIPKSTISYNLKKFKKGE